MPGFATPTRVSTHAELTALGVNHKIANHVTLVADDDGAGHGAIYRWSGTAWVAFALAVANLATGATNTVLWSDGSANAMTTTPIVGVSLQVRSAAAEKTVIRDLAGVSGAAIYMGNVTPDLTNFVLTHYLAPGGGAAVQANVPGSTGVYYIGVNGVGSLAVKSDRIQLSDISGVHLFEVERRVTNVAPAPLTIRSQAPFASAGVGNQTPGDIILDVPAPVGVGTNRFVKVDVSSNTVAQVGSIVNAKFGAIWLGKIATPDGTNFALLGEEDVVHATFLNASTTSGTVVLGANGLPVVNVKFADSGLTNLLQFTGETDAAGVNAAARIEILAQTGNNPTHAITVLGQAPSGTATGSNLNSGPVLLETTGAPGGTVGRVAMRPGQADAFSADSATQLTLFGSFTWTRSASAPAGVPAEGQMHSRSGGAAGTGDLFVGVNGAWVSTTSGASGTVSPSLTLTAGAGLTGGGDLSTNRTFNVGANADGSITVNADDIQVGVINDTQHGTRGGGALHAAVTNAAAGFAPLISNADRVLLSTSGTAATWGRVDLASGQVQNQLPQSGLSTAGASLGMALVFNGSNWAPGTDFGAQNLTSTGTLGLGTAATTNKLRIDSGVAPAQSQIRVTANGAGGISLTVRAVDDAFVGFDVDYAGAGWTARNASAGLWYKIGAKMVLYGDTGLSSGSTYTPTPRANFDLSNGHLRVGDGAAATQALEIAGTGRFTSLGAGIAHLDSTGVFSSSAIVNADVSASAAIAVAKLAGGTNGQILATVTATPTWVTAAGDVTGAPSSFRVEQLRGNAGTSIVSVLASEGFIWGADVDHPNLSQLNATAGSGGVTFTFAAQSADQTTGTGTGGSFDFATGLGHSTGVAGSFIVRTGGLGGTARFTIGPGLSSVGDLLLNLRNVKIDASVTDFAWQQTIAVSGSGSPSAFLAQDAQQSGDTAGGDVIVGSGLGHGAGVAGKINGDVFLRSGSTDVVKANSAAGVSVLTGSIAFPNGAAVINAASAHPVVFQIAGSTLMEVDPDGVIRIQDLLSGPLTAPGLGMAFTSIAGRPSWFGSNSGGVEVSWESKVVGTASAGAATLPSNPVEFLTVFVNHNLRRIPLYS